mgnify:CR=1 FL=1
MRIYLFIFIVLLTFVSCKRPNRNPSNNSSNEKIPSLRENRRTVDPIENKEKSDNTANSKSSKSISELFQSLQSEVFMIFTKRGEEKYSQGSGFFIAPGIGVTNYHVLEDSEKAVIAINGKTYHIIRILESSNTQNLDYVIFKTSYRTDTPLKISRKKPRVGENIFTIGSPKGLSNSLSKGAISGLRENERIQIDATIDHGSSGGPLFNKNGKVIGITTSGLKSGAELNFAVDIQALPYEKYVD